MGRRAVCLVLAAFHFGTAEVPARTAASAAALSAQSPAAVSAQKKISLIKHDIAPAGSRVVLAKEELNAFVRTQVAQVAPAGVRGARLELGTNRATGFAYIDFPKLRQAQGRPMGWLMSRLLAGERPVRVDARIQSGAGKATVNLDSVQISGITVSGGALDYLIRNFLWTYYPDAKVGRPFELAHRIDRLEVQPQQVQVVIGR
jgi:hypothetical protein